MKTQACHSYIILPSHILARVQNYKYGYNTNSMFETYAVAMVTAGTVLLRVVSPLSKNKWVGALT